jgi:hypothetical protein
MTLVRQPLSREVAKLSISLPAACPKREALPIAKSANFFDAPSDRVTGRVTRLGAKTQNPSQAPEFSRDFVTGFLRGGRDLNPRPPA